MIDVISNSNDTIDNMARVRQQNLTPTAVKTGTLGPLMNITTTASATSATLNNGDRTVFIVTIKSNTGDGILAGEVYMSLYVDSVSSANLLPGGSGVNESNWIVQGPFFYWDQWSGVATQAKLIVVVRNVSAGAHTIIIKEQSKYISNRPKAAG